VLDTMTLPSDERALRYDSTSHVEAFSSRDAVPAFREASVRSLLSAI